MNSFSNSGVLYRLTILLIICIGVARIVSTYRIFNQTVDESSNIACGMQLLQDRTYYMDVKHPPLARITVALGPFLAGSRLPLPGHGDDMFGLGNVILNNNNNYWRDLTLARLGTLPFFVLGCAVVWCWGKHLSGKWAALLSLLFFTLLPSVLAHASLSTNDMAGAATLCLALYGFTRWLESPSWGAAARLGVGTGLATVSKFSALLFLPACAVVLMLLSFAVGSNSVRKHPLWKIACHILLSLTVGYLVLWAGYLFTVAPLQASRPHTAVDRLFGTHSVAHDALYAILETPIPAGKVVAGVAGLAGQNKAGQVSFFLGEWRRHGWWYFFPIMFLVKTPIPFLLLCLIGSVHLLRSFRRELEWQKIAPVVFAFVILALSMTSHINIGLRHILAIFPLLSIVSGCAALELWNAMKRPVVSRFGVVAISGWLVTSSALAHPDYLAYFNFLSTDQPERIEVDSDLDWGQDLARLSTWLRTRDVQEIALSYFGTADLTRAGLPAFHELRAYENLTGWVAISARNRVIPSPFVAISRTEGQAIYYSIPGDFDRIRPGTGPFAWLMAYNPITKIGKSIFVYWIPAQKTENSGAGLARFAQPELYAPSRAVEAWRAARIQ